MRFFPEEYIVIEIELKFRCSAWAELQSRLTSYQPTTTDRVKEIDHYFNAPDRDFKRTDEVVRLRKSGTVHSLTYKGPKLPGAVKSRLEVELPLQSSPMISADAVHFLTGLGFRPVAVVTKVRQTSSFERNGFQVHVCFDDVGAIGKFIELEIVTEPENGEAARVELTALAAELELTAVEQRSYLRLLMETSQAKPA